MAEIAELELVPEDFMFLPDSVEDGYPVVSDGNLLQVDVDSQGLVSLELVEGGESPEKGLEDDRHLLQGESRVQFENEW